MKTGTLRDSVSDNDYQFMRSMLTRTLKDADRVESVLLELAELKGGLENSIQEFKTWLSRLCIRSGVIIKVGKDNFNCTDYDPTAGKDEVLFATEQEIYKHNVLVGDIFSREEFSVIVKMLGVGYEIPHNAGALHDKLSKIIKDKELNLRRIKVMLNKYGHKED